jgi:hypothetical protein
MDRLQSDLIIERTPIAYYDVSDRVKSWGRRGIMGGGLFGFALGAVLVAIPHADNILTFGVVGTLIVAVVEGAVIAGAFAACAAALYSKGIVRGKAASVDRALPTGRRLAQPGWHDGDIPSPDWPARWAFPTSVAARRSTELFTPFDGDHRESHD